MIDKLLETDGQIAADYSRWFQRDEKLAIYGAGNLGKKCAKILRHENYCVEVFLDKNADKYKDVDGVRVLAPDDITAESVAAKIVIVCLLASNRVLGEIYGMLKGIGFGRIVNGYNIITEDMFRKEDRSWRSNFERRSMVKHAYQLLYDDESRTVFCENLEAHLKNEYDHIGYNRNYIQYFKMNLEREFRYDCFVDCGAFIGDTLAALLDHGKRCNTYVGFEPDINNYRNLSDYSQAQSGLMKQLILFPCGVGRETGICRFTSNASGDSCISEDGETQIMVVTIDDALNKFEPTCIKMDIEGAERDALLGAEKTIRKNVPDLEICVYHRVEHLWEILLWLDSLCLDYKFALRRHYAYSLETVLYAWR